MDVVALGELLIDFTALEADPQGYPTMTAHPGGAPANFLAAVAKLGGSAGFLGKVGEDAFGKLLKNSLKEAGIDLRGLVMDPTVFTTLAFVTLDAEGDRDFSFARKPGADTLLTFEELDLSLIDEAKAFHFGTLSLTRDPARTATQKAVAYAKEQGKLISFDPNLRLPLWSSPAAAREQMLWGLGQAEVVKLSREEGEFLFGCGPEDCAGQILKNYGCKLVFVTCGKEGCWFDNGIARGMEPALSGIEALDTTGAGDIFGGSALWKLLQAGIAPEKLEEPALRSLVRFANTAAGLSTTRPGGLCSVPSPEEIYQYL